jgi:hypothetical protein
VQGNTRPAAGGERTLMGPAAQRSRRAPKRLSPPCGSSAETNERAKGWKVGLRPGGSKGQGPRDAGQSNDMAETNGTGLAPVGSPPEESNQQARRPVPAPALPGRRLLKRIGALKPTERGEGDTA